MLENSTLRARKKMMDLLAQREHSEKELREKLAMQWPEAVIDDAIRYGKKNQWLSEPWVLSEKWADMLHRRYKGILYINHYLQERGLPAVPIDDNLELEKARHLVKNRYLARQDWVPQTETKLSPAQKNKAARFLANRGFDEEIVRKVIENV